MYLINTILGIIFLVCYSYQLFYIVVAFVKKPEKSADTAPLHRFAVLISARNEEKVIGELIDSIKLQDYPSEYVTTYVVADNCTDRTAQIAAEHGAVVFERENHELVGKGYALAFLFGKINSEEHSTDYDAFFIFDADNVLSQNYITEMNKTYSEGFRALTSYRNSKNYGDNWISAGYALWFLREAKYLNNSRMILGTSCAVSGTGFLVDRSLLENEDGKPGWNYFLLTEDIEFTASSVVNGERIGYCGTAEFYDEQPVKFRQSWNQRMRWAKGYLQVFANYGRGLISGIFNKKKKENEYRGAFACFDMSMTIMPAMILSGFMFVLDVIGSIVLFCLGRVPDALRLLAMPTFSASALVFIIGIITTVTEWSHIHTTTVRKILAAFTFPIFMLTYIPIALVAVCKKKVRWDPIAHSKCVSVDDIRGEEKEPEKIGNK